MPAPLALQLYTVRDALAEDFTGIVKSIADIGYVGVETAGFPGTTPAEAGRLLRDLGLAVAGAHTSLPLGERKNEVLDTVAELGCARIICASVGREYYTSVDQIKRACDLLNEAHTVVAECGMSFGVHNHWWEFELVDGRYPYRIMLERLNARVFFEIDTYWVQTAGSDPTTVLRELGDRAPLLHIKDGPAVKGEPQVAVGDGGMDFPSIIQAGERSTEWLIVELDECATDMMDAVRRSYRYLVGAGLAHGSRG